MSQSEKLAPVFPCVQKCGSAEAARSVVLRCGAPKVPLDSQCLNVPVVVSGEDCFVLLAFSVAIPCFCMSFVRCLSHR